MIPPTDEWLFAFWTAMAVAFMVLATRVLPTAWIVRRLSRVMREMGFGYVGIAVCLSAISSINAIIRSPWGPLVPAYDLIVVQRTLWVPLLVALLISIDGYLSWRERQ